MARILPFLLLAGAGLITAGIMFSFWDSFRRNKRRWIFPLIFLLVAVVIIGLSLLQNRG